MHILRPPPTAARRRDGTDITAQSRPRKRADDSNADRDSPAKPARSVTQIPGIRERAPRRNALVVFLYLLAAVFLAGLLGRLIGTVPLSTVAVVSEH